MTLDKILSRLEPVTESGCLIWTGQLTSKGYGRVVWNGKVWRVHRLLYELENGSIPNGMVPDHLCRVRCCANSHHIEIVTNRTNVLRGIGLSARHARKTHCIRGHPFSGENLRIANRGERVCVACIRLHYERWRAKRVQGAA